MNAPALPRWRVFPALALGTLMATLDISVVNIALPTLSRTFHVSLTTVEWVVLAYVLTITGLLLTLGRLADLLGRRRVYGYGLAIFTLASALCAVSPSAAWLIAARAVQGLGAAMMTANSAAILIANFGPAERGRALGAFGATVGVGLALGPPLGGLIVGHLSWRWIFAINLPLGLMAIRLLRRRVPEDPPADRGASLHVPAAMMWCGALVSLMLALSRGPAHGWGGADVWPALVAAALLLAGFLVVESRSERPLLPLELLRGPLGVAVCLTMIGNALSISVGFQLPLYLEDVLRFDAAKSGAWLAVMPLVALVFAPLAGRWSDRAGTRPLSFAGMLITAAGFALMAQVGTAPQPAHILGGMALIGAGLGLFTAPNSSALMSAVPHAKLGLASGLQATMRNLGISGGAAAMAALVATRFTAHGGGVLGAGAGGANPLAFASATRDAYFVMAAVAVLGAILSLGQIDTRKAAGAD